MAKIYVGFLQNLLFVIIINSTTAQDEECEGYLKKPLYCYECQASTSNPNYCADPFNATLLANNVSVCEGHCVKWVREARPGELTYTRTCSTRLKIKMMINIVCMEESRPRSGEICFCKDPKCNLSSAIYFSALTLFCGLLLFKEWT
ncbi:protein quiver-like [Ostrea edulis]|uniref:protein quiver-like n=1 Tax=Ostrea edulis TaxID=37623 RepID=UPI002094EC0B|nr:protein quiver-like [Ostrea edulis]